MQGKSVASKLSYGMTIREDLTPNENSANVTTKVLDNCCIHGSLRTVATMVNKSEDHLTILSHPSLVSGQHSNKELINPQGTSEATVVFSGILEDVACRPSEDKSMCFQCGREHYVHTKEKLMGIFVTKDPELYLACAEHGDNPDPTTIQDFMIRAKIYMNNYIYVKMVLINHGGLYARNFAWIDCILDQGPQPRLLYSGK